MTLGPARLAMIIALVGCTAHRAPVRTTAAPLGVRTFTTPDPLTGAPLALAAIYPAARPGPPAALGPYAVAASLDAPLAAGRWPLVVISHGHAGSLWGHHDLAEALARAGYLVALVEHAGDSWHDDSGARSDRVMYGRAYQVSAAIDRVLADPALAPHVDARRIGVAGFSAGGYTALAIVGAAPDLARIPAYCARHPSDPEICGGPGRTELTAAQRRPLHDPRVSAAFVMAPFAVPFGPASFRAVRAPIFLAWSDRDAQLLPAENALAIRPALTTLAGQRELRGAGHFVFLAPCTPALAARIADLCRDAPGIDRAAIHAQLAADAIAFFAASLAS